MPQLIAITTAGHYTDQQRAALKADVEQQLAGHDIKVLIMPPGAQLQQGWVSPVAVPLQDTVGTNSTQENAGGGG